MGNVWVYAAHSKVLAVSVAVFAARGIIKSSIMARHAMRPFVEILRLCYKGVLFGTRQTAAMFYGWRGNGWP